MKAFQCNKKENGTPFYFLDTNAFIEFGRFYQKGKCSNPDITKNVKKLIFDSQSKGGCFEIELVANELAYDYGTNSLNNEVRNRSIKSVETLIQQIPKENLETFCHPTHVPFVKERDQNCKFKSIFECDFPNVFLENSDMCNLFYISYLYRLKIQELYQEKNLTPMERIKQLFHYMTDNITFFGDIEFQIGKMLFIGQNSTQFAKSLIKVDKPISIALINNTVADIVLFRIARMMGQVLAGPVYFVTSDKGLQYIFETNTSLLTNNILIPSLCEDSSDVRLTLIDEWEAYYSQVIKPAMYHSFIASFLNSKDINSTMDKVKKEIKHLEPKLFSNNKLSHNI